MKFIVVLSVVLLAIFAAQSEAERDEAKDEASEVTDFEDEGRNPEEGDDDDDNDNDELDEDELDVPKRSPGWSWSRRRRSRPVEQRCKAPRRQGSKRCSMDGCSAKFMAKKYNDLFKTSCDEHDCCYQFKTCSRGDCDKAFKVNTKKKCSSSDKKCNGRANLYYWAVRIFGGSSYGKTYSNGK